jgi:hypothetical protein|tara:strand:- start:374 stop:838 length:465 start_codon:yes stop_codon:yes gene_type:complete
METLTFAVANRASVAVIAVARRDVVKRGTNVVPTANAWKVLACATLDGLDPRAKSMFAPAIVPTMVLVPLCNRTTPKGLWAVPNDDACAKRGGKDRVAKNWTNVAAPRWVGLAVATGLAKRTTRQILRFVNAPAMIGWAVCVKNICPTNAPPMH